jgi:hypothetical protein
VTRIIIRNARRLNSFIGRRGWMRSKARAQSFRSTHEAFRFCHEHNIRDAEVVVHFDQPGAADVRVSVPVEFFPLVGLAEGAV